jgi:hypothetical protein
MRHLTGIPMAIDAKPSIAKTAGINQAGVAEAVGQDDIPVFGQDLNQSQICLVAGTEHQRGFRAFEGRQALLEFGMRALCARDQSGCAGAHAITSNGGDRRFKDSRMGCKI